MLNAAPNAALSLFRSAEALRHPDADLSAPDALLGVERGEHYGFVVDAGGVAVDGGSGLGAEVAVAGVEVESADVVGAMGAGEPHASLDARHGVETFHNFECSLLARER
jgi:hypothetical protein